MTAMSAELFPRTLEVIREGVATGVAPGMVAGVWIGSRDEAFVANAGNRRSVPSAQPMLAETIFDLASVSKVVGAATLAATLIERRWIDWSTPLSAILPVQRYPGIELRHLLSHTGGFIWWEPFWERLRARFAPRAVHEVSVAERQAAMREMILAVVPKAAPGEKMEYSDISFLLLGFAIEEVLQMPLDRAVRELVWEPMGLEGLFYRHTTQAPGEGRLEHVAATENCPWRGGVLQGQVHDDNTWAMGGYAAHAGIFGSVRDVLHFARRFFDGYLSRETLSRFWTRVSEPAGCERTPGWDTPSAQGSSAGQFFAPGTVGHTGFTGTSLWIDPSARIAVSLLTNRVHPTRENLKIREFRPRFHDALRRDLSASGFSSPLVENR